MTFFKPIHAQCLAPGHYLFRPGKQEFLDEMDTLFMYLLEDWNLYL